MSIVETINAPSWLTVWIKLLLTITGSTPLSKEKKKEEKKETEAAAKTVIKASARVKRLNKYQKSQRQTWQLCRGTQLVQRLLKLIPHELHHCVLSMESQCIRITSRPAKSPLP